MPYSERYFTRNRVGSSHDFAKLFEPGGLVLRVDIGHETGESKTYFLDARIIRSQSEAIRKHEPILVPTGKAGNAMQTIYLLKGPKHVGLLDAFPYFINYAYAGYYVPAANSTLSEMHGNPVLMRDFCDRKSKNKALDDADAKEHTEFWTLELMAHVKAYCLADILSAWDLKNHSFKQIKSSLERCCSHNFNSADGKVQEIQQFKVPIQALIVAAKLCYQFVPADSTSKFVKVNGKNEFALNYIARALVGRLEQRARDKIEPAIAEEVREYLESKERFTHHLLKHAKNKPELKAEFEKLLSRKRSKKPRNGALSQD